MSKLNGRIKHLEQEQQQRTAAAVGRLFGGLDTIGKQERRRKLNDVIAWLCDHALAPALPESSIWDCTIEQRQQWIAGARERARGASPALFDEFMDYARETIA